MKPLHLIPEGRRVKPNQTIREPSFWRSPAGWVFLGFSAIAAFFLLAEHRAHVLGVLPFLLLGLCLVLHLFGHGGHGGHGAGGANGTVRRGGDHEH